MAEIAPFRGILYTPKSGHPSRLLAPPYDVISPAEREQLATLDPHNCVHLILPAADAGDAVGDSRYARAAALYESWLAEGALARDPQPAIYRYHQAFEVYGQPVVRKGYIARIRLRRFEEGVVLPHERTLSGPKADRLKLMRATRAHFSQIFGLYNDPGRVTDQVFAAVEAGAPDLEGRTNDGVSHRVWRLVDPAAQRTLSAYMADQKIYIADGHHRYETMLTLAAELRPQAVSSRAASEYGVMFFCNMDDPGLVVLPTHRVLHGLGNFDRQAVLRAAAASFEIEEAPLGEVGAIREKLAALSKERPSFAMLTPGATPGTGSVAYLRLRADFDRQKVPALAASPVLADLDVTLLHSVLFEVILGVSREAQEKQTHLRYVKDWNHALTELRAPDVQAVFVMNPTRVGQVKAVADVGQVMPQKSTFFYPKIASGIVINPIDPKEEV
jgi:uncharacterized protein (DUF1015 family)